MGWLSNWLQELIMIVLLATFVDMLLPNRSMERYVKLVLSLLILLTLLSPITKLLKSDPVGELKRAMSAMDAPADGNATLEQILAQGKRLQSNEQEQSLQWTAKELANVMKGQIEETTGAKVRSVEVQLAMSKYETEMEAASSVELPVIQRVLVEMAGEKAGGEVNSTQQEVAANTQPIFGTDTESEKDETHQIQQPIQIGQIEVPDVQIDVSKSQHNGNEASSEPVIRDQADESKQQGETSTRSEHAVQIITLLTEKWDIDANNVQVTEPKSAEVL
ncbi:stage III sporulation protein AF [Paenibacillus sp. FSL R5-0766]|uniref:stage III sporulation protein AF n=1 Tax=unclassified Paenibacillus TaxID=185978 RepID=UPI00096C95D3|nr:stage III sporulation protein AF [Paenibacillus sp. FSL R5-0765]OMF60716.1 stage III sporulation protein AF [Paenibacillus sp. FSL R5-0765]